MDKGVRSHLNTNDPEVLDFTPLYWATNDPEALDTDPEGTKQLLAPSHPRTPKNQRSRPIPECKHNTTLIKIDCVS